MLSARETFVPPWTDGTIRRLTLEPLSAATVAKLASLLPEAAVLSQRQREELVQRSDGVPLFLEELVRTAGIMESGNIPHRSVRFSRYKIPPALRDPLLARLALPQVDLELAQAAATIGRDFDEGLLARMIGGDPSSFSSRLGTLFDAGLLEHSQDRLRFRHELIREIAYETQSHVTLVARHSSIADELLSPRSEDSLRQRGRAGFPPRARSPLRGVHPGSSARGPRRPVGRFSRTGEPAAHRGPRPSREVAAGA